MDPLEEEQEITLPAMDPLEEITTTPTLMLNFSNQTTTKMVLPMTLIIVQKHQIRINKIPTRMV
jgi:hypothetical protein